MAGNDFIYGHVGSDIIHGRVGEDDMNARDLYGELGDDMLWDPTSWSGNTFDCGPGDYDLSSRYTAGDTVNCEGELTSAPGGECAPDVSPF